jgi:hypothetical protein
MLFLWVIVLDEPFWNNLKKHLESLFKKQATHQQCKGQIEENGL